MKISAKIDYACRALLDLSLHWPNKKPVQIQSIAKRQNIPLKFLIQILLYLKQFEIIQSIRGKNGGYLLNRDPKKIKLSEVISYFDNSALLVNENLKDNKNSVFGNIWAEVDDVILNKLDSINFEMICNQKRKADHTVTFEI